jgi:hypothetical protein
VDQDQQRKLRRHYLTMRGQQRVIDHDPKTHILQQATVDLISEALAKARTDFPKLIPQIDLRISCSNDGLFYVEAVRAYLAMVIGAIEAEMETEEGPVTESKSFPFIQDSKIREIVERDYVESQRAFVSQCWKSTIVLAGGMIEATLTDLLLANAAKAMSARNAPKKPDITKWDLADIIEVAVELSLVPPAVSKLSHPIREYRNLVHPGNEIRTGLVFGREEARIAIDVLGILHRELV